MSIKAIIYCDNITKNHDADLDILHNDLIRLLILQRDKTTITPPNVLIAVDGGANSLYRHQIIPEVIIGDMDSIQPEILDYYLKQTVVKVYPVKKDKTDTELALDWCIENRIKDILILNNLQGNFAHTIGIVMLLFKAREQGIRAEIFNYRERVLLLPNKWSYRGKRGKKVSLIPLTSSVTDVETIGLEYPLEKEELFWHSTRGLSNVFIDEEITICYRSGELLGVLESSLEEIL